MPFSTHAGGNRSHLKRLRIQHHQTIIVVIGKGSKRCCETKTIQNANTKNLDILKAIRSFQNSSKNANNTKETKRQELIGSKYFAFILFIKSRYTIYFWSLRLCKFG